MDAVEIGIVDTRNILKIVSEKYHYDLSDFSLISLKRRIEYSIQLHNMKFADVFLTRLKEDADFFDIFLSEIAVDSTEMFRDPSLWRILRDDYFPKLITSSRKYKIWLPSCVAGDELFSVLILLHESGMLEKVEIIASCSSSRNLEKIKQGFFKSNKLEVSEENYKRMQGRKSLKDYYRMENNQIFRDISLLKNVTFLNQSVLQDPPPRGMDMILYRNQMIYFMQSLQDKITTKLWDALSPSGHLIVGIRERISSPDSTHAFKLVNDPESIYQKR